MTHKKVLVHCALCGELAQEVYKKVSQHVLELGKGLENSEVLVKVQFWEDSLA